MSGIGKGTVMSSIGVLLRSYNIPCTALKIDPYLNVDAGTMSPHEHGEVSYRCGCLMFARCMCLMTVARAIWTSATTNDFLT